MNIDVFHIFSGVEGWNRDVNEVVSVIVFIGLAFLHVAAWAALLGGVAIAIIRKRFSTRTLVVVATAVCIIAAMIASSGPFISVTE